MVFRFKIDEPTHKPTDTHRVKNQSDPSRKYSSLKFEVAQRLFAWFQYETIDLGVYENVESRQILPWVRLHCIINDMEYHKELLRNIYLCK